MILLVQKNKEKQQLLEACEKTAFGCKISAVAKAYGFDRSFASFFLDTESTAMYCMLDGVVVIAGTVINGEEASNFLRALGAKEVLCAVRNAELLGFPVSAVGEVLKKPADSDRIAENTSQEVNLRDVYALLQECGMVEEFEPFYLDLSHRLRHDAAKVVTEYLNDELIGCAVLSAINDSSALLSALAVREKYRRHGLGSLLVRRAEELVPEKTVYVFREKGKNAGFYKRLLYKRADTWVSCVL